MYRIDTGELASLQQGCHEQSAYANQLLRQLRPLYYQLSYPHLTYVNRLQNASSMLVEDLLKVATYFQTSIQLCDSSETQLQSLASSLNSTMLQNASSTSTNVSNADHSKRYKANLLKFTKRFHTTFNKDRNLIGYLKNGACVGLFAGFDAFKGQASKSYKYAKFGGEVGVGSGSLSLDAKALLFKNGKFNPQLYLEGDVSATLAQARMYANIGNDYLSVQGEGNLKVGCASAQAKAVISRDEVTLKAEVGAAAVRGEVKGTLSIFGVKITATGIGEVGSVGASAEFSSKKGELEFGTKASLFAGLGFKIRVTY